MRLGDKRNISISGQSLKWFSFARAIPTISTVPRIYNSKYPLLAGSSSSYSADNKSWPWLSPWPGRYQNPPLPELRILFSCHRVQLSRASHCGSVTAATIKSEISHTDEIFGLCRRSPSNISHFVSSSYCTLLLPIVYLEHRPGWWQDRLQPPGQVWTQARLARPSLYQRINIRHKAKNNPPVHWSQVRAESRPRLPGSLTTLPTLKYFLCPLVFILPDTLTADWCSAQRPAAYILSVNPLNGSWQV